MEDQTMNIIVTSVIIPIALALTTLLITFINAKTNEIKKNMAEKELIKYIDIAEDAVITAVVSVSQTITESIKRDSADGKLTSAEIEVAFMTAKNTAISIMGVKARDAVSELYGDFEEWISNKIEYYVNKTKVIA